MISASTVQRRARREAATDTATATRRARVPALTSTARLLEDPKHGGRQIAVVGCTANVGAPRLVEGAAHRNVRRRRNGLAHGDTESPLGVGCHRERWRAASLHPLVKRGSRTAVVRCGVEAPAASVGGGRTPHSRALRTMGERGTATAAAWRRLRPRSSVRRCEDDRPQSGEKLGIKLFKLGCTWKNACKPSDRQLPPVRSKDARCGRWVQSGAGESQWTFASALRYECTTGRPARQMQLRRPRRILAAALVPCFIQAWRRITHCEVHHKRGSHRLDPSMCLDTQQVCKAICTPIETAWRAGKQASA